MVDFYYIYIHSYLIYLNNNNYFFYIAISIWLDFKIIDLVNFIVLLFTIFRLSNYSQDFIS